MHKQRRILPVHVINYDVTMRDNESNTLMPREYDSNEQIWVFICSRCKEATKPGASIQDGRFVKVKGNIENFMKAVEEDRRKGSKTVEPASPSTTS